MEVGRPASPPLGMKTINATNVNSCEKQLRISDTRQIRDLFLRQANAETAHDIAALENMFAYAAPGQPDPVSFVARSSRL